ncbi:MAG: GNAT family N-acetyltransferase [Candidatus Omnitrophica bacterium]|nr:GNAT family N-acetyltransferase [Candidatus Omnitrophota bacterium]MBU4457111.1 GNAT family N-acetyltransferase [Candidatus Omnitrophota bacterium]
MGVIKIKRIDDRDFASIGHIWDKVCAEDSANIFQMFDWACNWWKAYGYNKELLMLVVTDGDSPIAIAPLIVTRGPFNRIPARKVEFMYRTNFIIRYRKEDVIREVLNYLKGIQRSWDIIDFSGMDYDLEIIDLLEKEARRSGFSFLVKDGLPYPYVDMGIPWEEYWASRSNKLKKNLRYSYRLMERMGDMNIDFNTYNNSQSQEVKKVALEKMFALSLKGWKAKAGIAVGSSKESRDFCRGLMEIFSKKGKVMILFLEHKGIPVSFAMGVMYRNVYYFFKTGYDEEYAKMSPGNILMHSSLKTVSNNGVIRVELLKGMFPQKRIWLTGINRKARVIIFRKSLHSRILKFSETHLRQWLGLNNKGDKHVKDK